VRAFGDINLTSYNSNIAITANQGVVLTGSNSINLVTPSLLLNGSPLSGGPPVSFVYTYPAPYSVSMTTSNQYYALDSFGTNGCGLGFDPTYPYIIRVPSPGGRYHITWKVDMVTGDQAADFVGGARIVQFDNAYNPTTTFSSVKKRFRFPTDIQSLTSTAVVVLDGASLIGFGLELWTDSSALFTPPSFVRVDDLSALFIDDTAIQISVIKL
jgi:hypothetical protein